MLAQLAQRGIQLLQETRTVGDGGKHRKLPPVPPNRFFQQNRTRHFVHGFGHARAVVVPKHPGGGGAGRGRAGGALGEQAHIPGNEHGQPAKGQHLSPEHAAGGDRLSLHCARQQQPLGRKRPLLRHDPQQRRPQRIAGQRLADFART